MEQSTAGPLPAAASELPSVELLGIRFNPLSLDQLNALVVSTIDSGQRRIFANHNLHSLYLCHHDENLRQFYRQAFLAHIDGMSLVLLGRALGLPVSRAHRVTYFDWIHPLMSLASANGWRVFFLGGKPGVAAKAAAVLKGEFPALAIRARHGYFDTAAGAGENLAVLEEIAAYRPQLIFVGMGMPRQELWLLENHQRLCGNVLLHCGGCFDLLAGELPVPPRWVGEIGLEWLFRLCSRPGRVWRRYLIEPLFILGLLFKGSGRSGKEAS